MYVIRFSVEFYYCRPHYQRPEMKPWLFNSSDSARILNLQIDPRIVLLIIFADCRQHSYETAEDCCELYSSSIATYKIDNIYVISWYVHCAYYNDRLLLKSDSFPNDSIDEKLIFFTSNKIVYYREKTQRKIKAAFAVESMSKLFVTNWQYKNEISVHAAIFCYS